MNPAIPIYTSIAFLVAISIAIYMIAQLAKKYAPSTKATLTFGAVLAFYFVYLTTVGIACINGAFEELMLPPKIVRVTTLPLLIFLIGFIFNTNFYKTLLKNIPTAELIVLHRFRLIGSFFIILLSLELLPTPFALIAGLGDITTAISSVWVAKAIQQKKSSAKKLALFWNTFGLLDILATSSMAIFLTKVSMETGALGVDVLATFPFCFIPAFAPATIIFLHISIYKKLLAKNFS